MHYYMFLGPYLIRLKPNCIATMNYHRDHYRVSNHVRPISDKVDCDRGEVDKPTDQGAQNGCCGHISLTCEVISLTASPRDHGFAGILDILFLAGVQSGWPAYRDRIHGNPPGHG